MVESMLLRIKRIYAGIIANDREAHALIAKMAQHRSRAGIASTPTLVIHPTQSESRCHFGNSEQGAIGAAKGERKDGMECNQNEF